MMWIRTFLSGLLAATPLLYANNDSTGSCSLGGEFLYFQPLVDNTYFAIEYPNQVGVSGHRSGNKFKWEPAFRVQADYTFSGGCNDAELRYTRITGDRIRTNREFITNGTVLLPTQGFQTNDFFQVSGIARSKIEIVYQAVEATLGQLIYSDGCALQIAFKGGLQWADFHHHQNIRYESSVNVPPFVVDLKNNNRIWGVGPELMLEVTYDLPQEWTFCLPLSLTSSARTALLLGQDRSTFRQTASGLSGADVPVYFNISNADAWRLIPMWNIRVGIAYKPDFSCHFDTHIEVGYEMLTYHRASHLTVYNPTGGSAWSFDTYSDVGFHGPYVAVNIGF